MLRGLPNWDIYPTGYISRVKNSQLNHCEIKYLYEQALELQGAYDKNSNRRRLRATTR